MKNEIILYRPDDVVKHIEVRLDEQNETIWLTQKQMGLLFAKDTDTIGLHLKNSYLDKELDEDTTTEFSSVAHCEGQYIVY